MFYTYVLLSKKNRRLYVGSTEDLKKRIIEHNDGNGGIYTSRNRPFVLVFYEAYIVKADALKQEKFYKSGYGKEVLKDKIINSVKYLEGD